MQCNKSSRYKASLSLLKQCCKHFKQIFVKTMFQKTKPAEKRQCRREVYQIIGEDVRFE